jgi:hypothetical protein
MISKFPYPINFGSAFVMRGDVFPIIYENLIDEENSSKLTEEHLKQHLDKVREYNFELDDIRTPVSKNGGWPALPFCGEIQKVPFEFEFCIRFNMAPLHFKVNSLFFRFDSKKSPEPIPNF